MSSIDLNCRLLCASASAYAISAADKSGNYNPLDQFVNGKWVPDQSKAKYETQYNAVGYVGDPYVVTNQIDAALVGATSTELIIAYRGTIIPSFNWASFFTYLESLWSAPESRFMMPGATNSVLFNAQLQLSVGIKEAMDKLDPTGKLPIYFTGHNQGGGMANLGAMYISNNFPDLKISNVVTFAGLNCGNEEFNDWFAKQWPDAQNYQNDLDIVPLMPPTPEVITAFLTVPNLPTDFVEALNKAQAWENHYQMTGTLEYINAAGIAKQYDAEQAAELFPSRMTEIIKQIEALNFDAFTNANNPSCGYGYMKGVCTGTVCPS